MRSAPSREWTRSLLNSPLNGSHNCRGSSGYRESSIPASQRRIAARQRLQISSPSETNNPSYCFTESKGDICPPLPNNRRNMRIILGVPNPRTHHPAYNLVTSGIAAAGRSPPTERSQRIKRIQEGAAGMYRSSGTSVSSAANSVAARPSTANTVPISSRRTRP